MGNIVSEEPCDVLCNEKTSLLELQDCSVTDVQAKRALLNPSFREILSFGPMFEDIKIKLGINFWDYHSLDEYITAVEKEMKRRGDRNGNLQNGSHGILE